MQNIKLLVAVIVGLMVMVFGVAWIFSEGNSGKSVAPVEKSLVEGNDPHVRTQIELADETGEVAGVVEAASGSGEAGVGSDEVVTVVEFSDFQCPACSNAAPYVDGVLNKYEGKMKLIYRHFPLEQAHANAKAVAIVSEIMAEEGKFWEFHDLVFKRQAEWAKSDQVVEVMSRYAEELGVAGDRIRNGFQDEKYRKLVEEDVAAANRLRINATPTFFVNGVKTAVQDLDEEIGTKI